MAEVADNVRALILAYLADGMSLREVCRMEGMPERSAVNRDLLADVEFQNQYARACEIRADVLFDELLEIADDGSNDWMERKNSDGSVGDIILNGENVQRSRLRLDARKWAISKMNPKKYGDKLELGGTGASGEILIGQVTRTYVDPKS